MIHLLLLISLILALLLSLHILKTRESAIYSPYYNPDKVGNCKRDKKKKPVPERA
jgi:hypothetical protein